MEDKIKTTIKYQVVVDNPYFLSEIDGEFFIDAAELEKKGYKTSEQQLEAIKAWYDVLVVARLVTTKTKITVRMITHKSYDEYKTEKIKGFMD